MADNDEFTGEVDLSPEEQEALGQPSEEPVVEDEDESPAVAGMQSPEEEAADKEAAQKDLDESTEKQRTVPHQAMHEERQLRQQAQEQLKAAQDLNAKMAERMDMILQRITQPATQPQPEPEQIPDKETEPFAYMEYLEKQIQNVANTQQQTQQATQQEKQTAQLWESGNRQAVQYRESLEDPAEYDAAYNYMMQARGEELLEMGFPKENIGQMLQKEVFEGMAYAMQNQINPGKMLHNMAKKRGFAHKKPEIDYEKAAKANRSMSQGGTPRKETADMAALVNMSDSDFEKWVEVNGDKGLALAHGLQ